MDEQIAHKAYQLDGWSLEDVIAASKALGYAFDISIKNSEPGRGALVRLSNGCEIFIWPTYDAANDRHRITFHFYNSYDVWSRFKNHGKSNATKSVADGSSQDTHVQRPAKGKVFIAFSHDREEDCNEIIDILKKLDYEPLVLRDQLYGHKGILDTLAVLIDSADFGIVLLTPDDTAKRVSDKNGQYSYQPRPNVILEYGMLLMKLRPGRMLVFRLNDGKHKVDLFTDVNNLTVNDYRNSISASRDLVIQKFTEMCQHNPMPLNGTCHNEKSSVAKRS